MKRAAAPSARRLLPLAVGVLAAHLVLLLHVPAEDVAVKPRPAGDLAGKPAPSFATRTIAPVPPPTVVPIAVITPESPPAAVPIPVITPVPPAAAVPIPLAREASPTPAPAPRARPVPAVRPSRLAQARVLAQAAPAPEAAPAPAAADTPVPAPAASESLLGAGRAALAASPPLAAATLPEAVQLPPSAHFHYEVTATFHGLPLRGEGEIAWRHDGHSYELQMDARSPVLLGTRRQRSIGRVTEQGLVPEHFYDRARSEQATHFDPAKGRVTFSNNQPDAAWAAGMQDRLSVVLQLATIVGGQPERFNPGAQIVVPTASTREAETWVFTVDAEENLQLPGGMVHTLKLQRLPRRQYDVKVELWLAPRMDYAPVRLRLTNPNGDTVDQRWSSTDKG